MKVVVRSSIAFRAGEPRERHKYNEKTLRTDLAQFDPITYTVVGGGWRPFAEAGWRLNCAIPVNCFLRMVGG